MEREGDEEGGRERYGRIGWGKEGVRERQMDRGSEGQRERLTEGERDRRIEGGRRRERCTEGVRDREKD